MRPRCRVPAAPRAWPHDRAARGQLPREHLGTARREGDRNGYNNTVQGYNQTLVVFPTNLLAGLFGFKAMPFFQVDDAAQRVAPQVKF